MTPQQKRKAPIPYTDAAPRTRIPAPEFTNSANSSKNTGTESKPAETSSGTSDRVSHTVALSTPRGPGSLRKSLLLKSARQTWKETQSPGLEGAIENGSVQTRRKSLSPKVGTPSKAAPPPDSSDSEEEEEEEQAPTAGEMSDEEKLAEAAEEMSLDEDAESLAADVSLDIVSDDQMANAYNSLTRRLHNSVRRKSGSSMNQCTKVRRLITRKRARIVRKERRPMRMMMRRTTKTWKTRKRPRLLVMLITQHCLELQRP